MPLALNNQLSHLQARTLAIACHSPIACSFEDPFLNANSFTEIHAPLGRWVAAASTLRQSCGLPEVRFSRIARDDHNSKKNWPAVGQHLGLLPLLVAKDAKIGAPGLTTRSKKLVGTKGIATSNKEATRGFWGAVGPRAGR